MWLQDGKRALQGELPSHRSVPLKHHVTTRILNPKAALCEAAERHKNIRGITGIIGVSVHVAVKVSQERDARETIVRST